MFFARNKSTNSHDFLGKRRLVLADKFVNLTLYNQTKQQMVKKIM